MNIERIKKKRLSDINKEIVIEDFISRTGTIPEYRYISQYENEDYKLINNTKEFYLYKGEKSSFEKRDEESFLSNNMSETSSRKFEKIELDSRVLQEGRVSSLDNIISELENIESKINEEILMKDEGGIFSYSVIENFNDNSKINLELTTAEIKESFLTLKETESSLEPFKKENIKKVYASAYTKDRYAISSSALNEFFLNGLENGHYQHVCYSSKSTSEYYLEIELEFKKAITVEELHFNCLKNSSYEMFCEAYWSENYLDFQKSSKKKISNGENLISVNGSNITNIKLVVHSTKYNIEKNNGFGFVFYIGSLGVASKAYEKESLYYSAALPVLDSKERKINFEYATINSFGCSEIPIGCNVIYELSKDSENWIKASEGQRVSFGNNYSAYSFDYHDVEAEDVLVIENKYILNAYAPPSESNVKIKRIYRGVNSFDQEGNQCKYYVEIKEGSYEIVQDNFKINGNNFVGRKRLEAGTYLVVSNEEVFEEIKDLYLVWCGFGYEKKELEANSLNFIINENNEIVVRHFKEKEEVLISLESSSDENLLYIKAKLATNDVKLTPKIDNIKVRLI